MKLWLSGITLLALLLLAICGSGGWLLYSESGANWLLARMVSSAGGSIGTVEGTLVGQLRLRDLKIQQPETTLSCNSVELRSRLSGLYPLQLQIEQLHVVELSLDNQPTATPSSPPTLSWPELPWWLTALDVELQQLVVDQLRFKQDSSLLHVEQLLGRLLWSGRQLQISELKLQTPEFELSGTLRAAFSTPSLQTDLLLNNRQLAQPWQQVHLQSNLQATDNYLLNGPISVVLNDSQGPWLSTSGGLALTEQSVQFQQLQLQSTRRDGSLLVSGDLNLGSSAAGLTAQLQLSELDLQAEAGRPLRLSGKIDLSGSLNNYQGSFSVSSRAEQPLAARLSGNLTGDRQRLRLSELQGDWLQGQLSGQLQAEWPQGWRVSGQLRGQQLDPQLVHEQLRGTLNFSLAADLADTGQGMDGRLLFELNDSLLQQQPLTGSVELAIQQQQLEMTSLWLQGKDFWLQGKGQLAESIQLSWQIDQLQQLFSDLRGQMKGTGRVKIDTAGIAADFESRGQQLKFRTMVLDQWRLQGQVNASQQGQLTFAGHDFRESQSGLSLKRLQIDASGTAQQHQVSFLSEQQRVKLQGKLSGGWGDQQWQGNLDHFRLDDSQVGQWQTTEPVAMQLSAQKLQLAPLKVSSRKHGAIILQGSYLPQDKQGEGQLEWQALDLKLFQPWLAAGDLAGVSSGKLDLHLGEGARLQSRISLKGQLNTPRQSFSLVQSDWQTDWNAEGLISKLSFQLEDGSQVLAELGSEEKFAVGWPRQLRLQLSGNNIEMQQIHHWLPPGVNFAGRLNLRTEGLWFQDQPGQISGTAEVTGGKLFWQEDEDIISTELTTARLLWEWHKQLGGQLELQFAERGNIDASINLPLTASWPISATPEGPLKGDLNARLQELGLLSVLFPGRVQDSSGQLKLDLHLAGTWQEPLLQGEARLFEFKAFLPKPGIQLSDIQLSGKFDEKRLTINSLQVNSGEGSIAGRGEVLLANWQPQGYHLEIGGSDFQLFNLPELQAQVSPELIIDGDLKQVKVGGTLHIPRLLASGERKNSLAENSSDLIIVDAPSTTSQPFRLQPEIDIQLQLGEQVLLKLAGIDARLEGHLRMKSTSQQALAAFGEIQVAKGRYASYGVNLDIDRGTLLYNGGPIGQPLLDILALRTAGEVKAGVQVTGTPKRPVVKLYSEPSLPETDILSYIVLGRPVDAQGSQSGVLMTAAGALLSQGESVVLQEKLKSTLGLDVLDIDAGAGDTKSSVITTGKYLHPDLYVSFGYSLFENSNEVKLRYTLSPRWEVESNIGNESGADLFYKIDIP